MAPRTTFGMALAVALAVSALLATSEGPQNAASERVSAVRKIHQDAIERPFDPARFEAYLKTLPRFGESYLVEGDLVMTKDEVQIYLVSRSQAGAPADQTSELLVSTKNGRMEFYPLGQRTLSYAVDRASFPRPELYTASVENVAAAARAWEQACAECDIKFVHAQEVDAAPAQTKVSFTVRYEQIGFIALAFFPFDPPAERFVRLDPSYFTTDFDRVGILRHELGHVLGYRHEHAPGVAGCIGEGGTWHALTRYDSRSVMHYICDDQTGSKRLELSDLDREGHRKLYKPAGARPEAGFAAPPPPPPTKRGDRSRQLLSLHAAAIEKPFDEAARKAYMDALPKHDGYFIVEGDLRLTEDELILYVVGQGHGERFPGPTPELLVNLHRGQRDFYEDPSARDLTYAVDRGSFSSEAQYDAVVEHMRSAGSAWRNACVECGIRFTHLEKFDSKPTRESVNFIVRLVDAGGEFVASAFFPHDSPGRRTLEIDPSYFAGGEFDNIGVLRHELGHVLGYRHEHIRGVPGCYREDNEWRALTAYDPKSVMHYFCGNAGDRKLQLTSIDVAGHRKLYRLPTAAPSTSSPGPTKEQTGLLVVRLQGGDVVDSAARVIELLRRHDLLPLSDHKVNRGDSLETIYRGHLQLPWHSEEMTRLAGRLNQTDYRKRPLSVGDVVRYPALTFMPYNFSLTLPRAQAEQVKENWEHLVVEERKVDMQKATQRDDAKDAPPEKAGSYSVEQKGQSAMSNTVRLTLRGYEVRLEVPGDDLLKRVAADINALNSSNILVSVRTVAKTPARYYAGQQQWVQGPAMGLGPASEGDLGRIVAVPKLPPMSCGRSCPDILLLDTPVRLHPDIQSAIVEGGQPEVPPIVADKLFLLDAQGNPTNFAPLAPPEHGTYMAGIIASQENKFGLVGVNPKARIFSWDWEALRNGLNPTEVEDRIGERQDRRFGTGSLQMYVLATHWPVLGDLNPPEKRLSEDGLAVKMLSENLLVITAAGQADTGAPEDIGEKTPLYPVNLGDQGNVLVVTACEPCGDADARLWDRANYSTSKFVHIAAPGFMIPSTVGGGKYAQESGTSQATAFVAGIASLMTSHFPLSYPEAHTIKTRLQVTARPIWGSPTDRNSPVRVAAGIVNPELALLDPSLNYVKLVTGKAREEITDIKWVALTIAGKDARHVDEQSFTEQIYRIVRRADGQTVLFTRKKNPKAPPLKHQYMVERIGPLTIAPAEARKQLITFRRKDGALETRALADIEDLLLASPIRRVP